MDSVLFLNDYCIQYLCHSFSRINISKGDYFDLLNYALPNLLHTSQKLFQSFDYHDQPSHDSIQDPTMTTANLLLGVTQRSDGWLSTLVSSTLTLRSRSVMVLFKLCLLCMFQLWILTKAACGIKVPCVLRWFQGCSEMYCTVGEKF
jgi:hypothetical protein